MLKVHPRTLQRLVHRGEPPYVPFMAGRDGTPMKVQQELYPDDDECLRTGDGIIEKRSEWEGR